MIATIAAITTMAAKKVQRSLTIVSIISKPPSSDRSDRCADKDRWDRLKFYLDDSSDRGDHMETGSRKDRSSFSVAIAAMVAIIWKPALI